MHLIGGLVGLLFILIVLVDVFETIVLPRRVTRTWRMTRLLYRVTWPLWRAMARASRPMGSRESLLGIYGPLSLLGLLVLWALSLIVGFAALQWALGSNLRAPEATVTLSTDLYFSASTLFTLGLGDVVPRGGPARPLAMVEAGFGFGVLALVIGYLPTLYSAFSAREIAVSLLDARAGSPPSAGELLRRYDNSGLRDGLSAYLSDWERWAAELMESHLSYPMLAYFRSQHDNQSWLAALTTILDSCVLIIAAMPELPQQTAKLTFAMGRHAVVDLCQIFQTAPQAPQPERLTAAMLTTLCEQLESQGLHVLNTAASQQKLASMRASYEPYIFALSRLLDLPLPPWYQEEIDISQNWRNTAWEPRGHAPF